MKSAACAPLLVLLFVALAGATKDKTPPQSLAVSAIPTSKALEIASSPPSDAPSDAPSDTPSYVPKCKGQGKSGSKGRRRRRRNLSSKGKRSTSSKGSNSSKGYSLGDECQGDAYDEIDNYSYQSGGSATCGTVVAAAGALVAAVLI